MTLTAIAPPSTGVHVLRLDYPTHTAQIIDPHGRTVAIYSHIGGRDAACARVAADGWELAPGEWVITSPPDGREHPLRRASAHPLTHTRKEPPVTVTVTLTAPKTYTEAVHTVHAAQLHGVAPLYATSPTGLIKPDAITVDYDWRTQLGHTGWQLDGIELPGAWVTPAGRPDPAMASAPRTTLLLNADNAPDWAVSFARFRFPRFLALDLHGEPAQPATEPPLYDGEVPLNDITASTEIRHTVYDIEVTGAQPLRVPSHTPGARDRWMRPAQVGMVYRLPMRAERAEQVDQLGTVPAALGDWHLRDLSVTGPWVTETGRPVPHAVGTARWPGGERPGWLAELIARHAPDATTVPLRLA